MNIAEPIFVQCGNDPSELALCAPGAALNLISYGRLQRNVNNICRRMIAAEINRRNRIVLLIDDPLFHVLVVLALTRLGVVTVAAANRHVPPSIGYDRVITDRPYESPRGTVLVIDASWMEGDHQPIAERHLHRAARDDVCRIFVASGRDGRQKAIAMTHGMIATRLDRQKQFLGPRAPFCYRTHLDLPITTPLGFQVMLGTLWRGGALVVTCDMGKTLAALATYKVQNIVASPQRLIKFTEATKGHGRSNELLAAFAAGGITSEHAERVHACLCPNLAVGYMPADATMVASMPAHLSSGISGAVGYVLPGVTVEIVDEQGRVLPPDSEGNVRIRSDYGITGYLEDPVEAQRAFRDGWFYSGDRGRLSPDNMLILAGSPGDLRSVADQTDIEKIEAILSEHANIVQCGLAAVANEFGEHELCAFVVPRSYLDVEALRSYCKARLPANMVPARFVTFSDLPKNNKGIIDRARLPALLKNNLN
jgi:acyl-coenzyme A synthetase/AMP-(fatty) acid ligase